MSTNQNGDGPDENELWVFHSAILKQELEFLHKNGVSMLKFNPPHMTLDFPVNGMNQYFIRKMRNIGSVDFLRIKENSLITSPDPNKLI